MDITAIKGEKVFSPFDGKLIRRAVPYKNDPRYEGVVIRGVEEWTGYEVKIFYVEGLLSGEVKAGQEIGLVQDLTKKYPSITNHIHIEVRKNDKLMDPFDLWQMSF